METDPNVDPGLPAANDAQYVPSPSDAPSAEYTSAAPSELEAAPFEAPQEPDLYQASAGYGKETVEHPYVEIIPPEAGAEDALDEPVPDTPEIQVAPPEPVADPVLSEPTAEPIETGEGQEVGLAREEASEEGWTPITAGLTANTDFLGTADTIPSADTNTLAVQEIEGRRSRRVSFDPRIDQPQSRSISPSPPAVTADYSTALISTLGESTLPDEDPEVIKEEVYHSLGSLEDDLVSFNIKNISKVVPVVRTCLDHINSNRRFYHETMRNQENEMRHAYITFVSQVQREREQEQADYKEKLESFFAEMTSAFEKESKEVQENMTLQNEQIESVSSTLAAKQDRADILAKMKLKADKTKLDEYIGRLTGDIASLRSIVHKNQSDNLAALDAAARTVDANSDSTKNDLSILARELRALRSEMNQQLGELQDKLRVSEAGRLTLKKKLQELQESVETDRQAQKKKEEEAKESGLTHIHIHANNQSAASKAASAAVSAFNRKEGVAATSQMDLQAAVDDAGAEEERALKILSQLNELKEKVIANQAEITALKDSVKASSSSEKNFEQLKETLNLKLAASESAVSERLSKCQQDIDTISLQRKDTSATDQLAKRLSYIEDDMRYMCSKGYCEEYCDELAASTRSYLKALDKQLRHVSDAIIPLQEAMEKKASVKEFARRESTSKGALDDRPERSTKTKKRSGVAVPAPLDTNYQVRRPKPDALAPPSNIVSKSRRSSVSKKPSTKKIVKSPSKKSAAPMPATDSEQPLARITPRDDRHLDMEVRNSLRKESEAPETYPERPRDRRERPPSRAEERHERPHGERRERGESRRGREYMEHEEMRMSGRRSREFDHEREREFSRSGKIRQPSREDYRGPPPARDRDPRDMEYSISEPLRNERGRSVKGGGFRVPPPREPSPSNSPSKGEWTGSGDPLSASGSRKAWD